MFVSQKKCHQPGNLKVGALALRFMAATVGKSTSQAKPYLAVRGLFQPGYLAVKHVSWRFIERR